MRRYYGLDMIKYFKWIFLVSLIIIIFVLAIKFISFQFGDNNNYNEEIIDNEIEKFYGVALIKEKTITYMSDGITSGISGQFEEYYMILNSEYLSYCKLDVLDCIDYKYIYDNGKITIESEDYFVPRGVYTITFDDNKLELSQIENGNKTIHYFNVASG